MRILSFIVILCALASCHSRSEECKPDGYYEVYDKHKILQSKYYIKNCLYDGRHETYYINGKLKETIVYKMGVVYGIVQQDSTGALVKEANNLDTLIECYFPKERIKIIQNDSLQLLKQDTLKFSCKLSTKDINCKVLGLADSTLIYSSSFLIITDKKLSPYKIHSINTLVNYYEENGYLVFKIYDARDKHYTPLIDSLSIKQSYYNSLSTHQ